MSDDEATESAVGAEIFSTALQGLATETHEIFTELMRAGFPESAAAQVIAHLIEGALGAGVYEDSDDDDTDEDDIEDE